MAPLPLAGIRIAVTRPAGQAAPLAAMITAAGGEALLAPLLEIAPIADDRELRRAAAELDAYRLAIFISPNALEFSLPTLLAGRGWPSGLIPAAVGQGTARLLAAHGISGCVAPTERFDSESLLALPPLQTDRVAGQRVLILRGDGGRELLAETLAERGARVDLVSCYRRLPPVAGLEALRRGLGKGGLAAVTLSSSEGLRYLVEALTPEEFAVLSRLPVFVPHRRIAENASRVGICHTILTEPGDEGLLAGLCAYNWRQS